MSAALAAFEPESGDQIIKPHDGPQWEFLRSAADVAIFGGAAGGGKTWALLLEPLRHVRENRDFAAVYFRKSTVQIRNPGGLWDQSMRIYPYVGGLPVSNTLEWRWLGGGRVKFAHMDMEQTKLDWQGSELAYIAFDELTHFSESQFWYLFSRNRSLSGVRGYIRASCNPDSDSWVRKLIDWWISPAGFPIQERSGVLRWFARIEERIVFGDSEEELRSSFPGCVPKTLTFIPAKLDDNPTLNRIDPGYRANLLALPQVERERLLGGNWNIRPSAGLYFNRNWVKVIDAPPAMVLNGRGWDLAATPETVDNDPDYTTSTRIGRMLDGKYVVLDHTWMRGSPADVERAILNTATRDGHGCKIGLPQDPGQAGKAQIAGFVRMLAGFPIETTTETGDKVTRFSPFSAQAEQGNVVVLRGEWNERWFHYLEGFPEMLHDDDADSTARGFQLVAANSLSVWAAL